MTFLLRLVLLLLGYPHTASERNNNQELTLTLSEYEEMVLGQDNLAFREPTAVQCVYKCLKAGDFKMAMYRTDRRVCCCTSEMQESDSNAGDIRMYAVDLGRSSTETSGRHYADCQTVDDNAE